MKFVRLSALQGEQLPFGLTNHPNVVATHYHFYVQVGCVVTVLLRVCRCACMQLVCVHSSKRVVTVTSVT